MEPQTQTPGGVSTPPTGQSIPTYSDPQVGLQAKNLTKAIFQTESGGDYNAKGKSGESGAGQWTPDTWKAQAQDVLGDQNAQMTPENQSVVAQGTIRKLIGQGKNAAQIAAIWNSGSDQNWENKVGTNKYGVQYNVPKYVKSVTDAYQTLKTGGQVNADPNNPSSTAAPQSEDSPSVGGFLGNVVNSGANAIGGIASAIAHPVDTLTGIGNILIGGAEKGYNAVTGQNIDNKQSETFDQLVKYYGQRYGGKDINEIAKNILHSAYTDPVGVAMDASVLLSGGEALAGKLGAAADLNKAMEIAKAGGSIADMSAAQGTSVASRIAKGLGDVNGYVNPVSLAGKGVSAVGKAAEKIGTAPLGVSTGVGTEAISQGLKAASEGGNSRQVFINALRGNVSPEDLVAQAKSASAQVVAERNASYQQMLSKLGGDSTTYDISPIGRELQSQLKKFNISQDENGLDFSRSKFALDTTAQRDIETLNDFIKSYGTKAGDRTALGVDKLKQVLTGYYSPNSDYRAFTQGLRSSTRDVLNAAPGYTEEMKNYADLTDKIDETNKALSLGDKASVETAFKKLTGAMKNNDARLQIIKELDQATGGNLLAGVAGQRLSSVMPRGITAAIEGGVGISTLASWGSGGFLPLLGMAMTTSPRLVGEFINALGLSNQAAAKVMELLNKFRTPLTGAGIYGGFVSRNPQPTSQGNATPTQGVLQ